MRVVLSSEPPLLLVPAFQHGICIANVPSRAPACTAVDSMLVSGQLSVIDL